MSITDTIKANIGNMTKSEHRIALQFLENPGAFAFETLEGISKKTEISTASVIRFCRRVGFSGYKAFQMAIRAEVEYKLTLPDKLSRATKTEAPDIRLSGLVRNTMLCVKKTLEDIPEEAVSNAVKSIIDANRVFCFGLKESYALAHYAYTRFLTIRENVFISPAGQNGEIESILSIGKGDTCIFFLFHRYTKPAPKLLEVLKKQGATVILITSPPYDDIKENANILLPCFVDVNGIKNSAAAPVCLTDYLCNYAISVAGEKILNYMKKSEKLFDEFIF